MNRPAPVSSDGIALIGMAGRFPGAPDLETFWANLVAGVESVTAFTEDELVAAGVDRALVRDPAYVKSRALLPGAELFDAGFFGYTPSDAAHLDPQQRVFLECAWEALENAGCDPERFPGPIGLFAGQGAGTYLLANLCAGREWIDEFLDGRNVGSFQTFLGNDKDCLTTRVAYKLNLRGPAVTVQTACSTSLVAVCLACQSLLTHQSDVALAGGVSITFPQRKGYLYREGGITSPDGHCRAFDARAQGTVFGSGAGVVVLKRVADALADGDRIYAVIRGSALNNDGSLKVSYTAPSVDGQAEVILTAQTLAGVSPDTIGYVEAHGTGTPLGDPVELAALTQAFRLGTDRVQFCALGSVKTNIGHLDAAAGIAGLIKTALALYHRQIPPSLHYEQPNPQLDLAHSPFFVNPVLAAWPPSPGRPRRAGVSSFGIGGTNAHVVLEEAPSAPSVASARPAHLLVLSARTAAALEQATTNLHHHLQRHPGLNLADVACTLQLGRREFPHRRALVCRDTTDAIATLGTRDVHRLFTQTQLHRDVPVAFLFPGQGAQTVDMGRTLRESEPVFREHLEQCLALASATLGCNLSDLLFPVGGKTDAAEHALAQTQFTQPALFAVEYALAQLWLSWGIAPVAMIGHSVGEYVAACLAGVFSLEDAITLVVRRARLVQAQPGGAMLAVRLPADELAPWLDAPLSLAAINAPNLCVASGPADAIASLEQRLRAAGIVGLRLKTSHAFHSAMMEPVVAPLAAEVRKLRLSPPRIPYLSNVTGRWITDAEATSPDAWASHVRATVRFAASVAELLKTPAQVLLEVGPGQTLAALTRQQPAAKLCAGVFSSLGSTPEEAPALLSTLGRLWLAGVTPNWAGLQAPEPRQRVPLPTYPFERQRHFIEAPRPPAAEDRPCAPRAVETNLVAIVTTTAAPHRGAAAPGPLSPRDRLVTALITLFRDLSGVEFRAEDRSVPLLELGFDSLFLTQVRQSFQTRFGVNVTYRQLADSLNTVDALATFLAERVAADTCCVVADGGNELRTSPVAAATPELPSPPAAPPPPELASASTFGPYHPLPKSSTGPLTARQQAWLAEFTTRYNRRTATSKRLAAENRQRVADPRSLANYRPLWKELVYQIVVDTSAGAHLRDVDGNDYVDVTMGFGANLFGHSPAFVTEAVAAQLQQGCPLGPQSPLTGEVADLIREFTGLERVTFCNTGSEAVLAALRVARTVTHRSQIVTFAGAYHGLFDEVLLRPHLRDGLRRSVPAAPGIPPHAGASVHVLEYGEPAALAIIRQLGPELAAVLVEPIQSRRPELQPRAFLQELRRITRESGTLLIFDEVITGFRVHPGGAQAWFDVKADLATYGKTIGGGLPFGVLAGSAHGMNALDGGAWNFGDDSGPEADLTFFAGTFVRHPLALAAARASLLHLKRCGPELQSELNRRTELLAAKLNAFFAAEELPIRVPHFSSFFRFSIPPELPYATLLVYQLLERGIYFRDIHQNCFLSTAHTDADVARFFAAVKAAVAGLQEADLLPRRTTTARGPAAGKVEIAVVAGVADPAEKPTEKRGGFPGLIHLRPAYGGQVEPGYNSPPSAAPPPAFALTDAQQEIWLACQLGPELSRAYNQSLTLDLRGPLDLPALQAAWNELLVRHVALRLTISSDGATQQAAPAQPSELPFADWSAHAEPYPCHRTRKKGVAAEVTRQSKPVDRSLRLLTSAATLDNIDTADPDLAALVAGIATTEAAQAFDLTRGPLVRARVCRIAPEHHLFVFTAHHLVCDGWSVGVLFEELGKLYTARRKLLPSEPPILGPATSFREFVHLQEVWRGSPEFAADGAYWLSRFATLPPPLELPWDHPRSPHTGHQGGSERAHVGPELHLALKRVGARHGATLFATLLAAFKVLLQRLSGQEEAVVGVFTSGRALAGTGALVGHCVTLLPIRSASADRAEFGAFLTGINQLVLDARDHETHAYGRLLQRLKLPRDPARPPLIDALFNLEPKGDGGLNFAGLAVDLDQNAKGWVNFALFLNIRESAAGLILDFTYNRGLCEAATIRRWLGHYRTLLEGIVAHPESPLADLPLLTAAERELILVGWNRTAAEFPQQTRLHELFEARVKASPDAPAVTEGPLTLSYGELDRRANRLAHRLRGLNLGAEGRVALCLDRSIDLIVGLLATLKAGGVYVPLDPSYPPERLAFMLHDADATVLLTQPSVQDRLELARPGLSVVWVEESDRSCGMDRSIETDRSAPCSNPLAYILYTSGSTGRPKGVMVGHRAIVNHLTWRQRTFPLGAGDSFLQKASCSFDISLWEIFAPLIAGARLVLARPGGQGDSAYLAKLIADEKITDVHFGPGMLDVMLDEPALARATSLRRVFCGGEPLSSAIQTRFFSRCRAGLISQYGPTETTVDATWCPCDRQSAAATAPIGRPIANTRAYVVDRQLQPVPPGVAGELCLAGESLACGYLNLPEFTAERFVSDPFSADGAARLYHTGDRCRCRPDGVIEFLGRLDAQVKIRGFRIEPGEIEAALAGHPGVRAAFVTTGQDPSGGNRLVAYVVPRSVEAPETVDSIERELRDYLGRKLPAYLVPEAFVVLEALPHLPNGKIDRPALPVPGVSRRAETKPVAPATAAEKALARIWCEVLGVTEVSATDNFFALGGHSLLAMRIAARVRTAFQVDLPLKQLFETATLAALATVIEQLLLAHVSALSDEEARRAATPR